MSKYILADELKKIVEQAKQRALKGAEVDEDMYSDGRADAFGEVLLEIDSLLQDQPSIPSNLDEAAEKFAHLYDNGTCDGIAQDCFKAGAEWMAGQGVTKDAVIGMETKDIFINVSGRILDELDLCPGDKVVVQIRKK